jgi:hypothetical protein
MKTGDPTRIPLGRRRDCEQCGEVVDSKADGVAQLCTAWIPNRSGGGANSLVQPVYAERFLCKLCVELRRKGISWEQGRLPL